MKKVLITATVTLICLFSLASCSVEKPHIHEYGQWITEKDATCAEEGTKKRVCSCGEEEKQTVNKLTSHKESEEWTVEKDSDCTNEGTKCKKCSVCGVKLKSESIPKKEHIPGGEWITKKDPTCTEEGLEYKKCSLCGEEAVTEPTPAVAHDLTDSIVEEATSVKSGKIKKECKNCDYERTESYELSELSSEQIYAIGAKSVAEVVTYKKDGSALSLGTAFVIGADGKLITNYHVIEGAYSAKVTLGQKKYDVKNVLAYDTEKDLAVISVDATGLIPLKLQTEGVEGGSKVYAIGSSEGYTLSISAGIIASPDRVFNGVHYVQHEAAISHGNSGGPLFNSYGEVIGINTLTNIEGQNLNFAIKCSEISSLVYGTKLTLAQVCEAERSATDILRDYIMTNGEYSAEDNAYLIELPQTQSAEGPGTVFENAVFYYIEQDAIAFASVKGEESIFAIYVFEADYQYMWMYMSAVTGETMFGTVVAPYLCEENDAMSVYDSSFVNISDEAAAEALSEQMAMAYFEAFDENFADCGVTAGDLGFWKFTEGAAPEGEYWFVSSGEELIEEAEWAIHATVDTTIILLCDIELDSEIGLFNYNTHRGGSPVRITLDGNGYTVYGAAENLISVGGYYAEPYETNYITVKNMNIEYSGEGAVLEVFSGGEFVFENIAINCSEPIKWCVINMNLEENLASNPANVTLNNVDISMLGHGGCSVSGQTAFVRTGNPSSNYIGPYINLVANDCEWIAIETDWSYDQPMPTRGLHVTHSNARVELNNCHIKSKLHPIYITSNVRGQLPTGTVIVEINDTTLEIFDDEGTTIKYDTNSSKQTGLIYTGQYASIN